MQKIKQVRKHLVLRREAIRLLDRAEIAAANGGGNPTTITAAPDAKVSSSACHD